MHKVILVSVLLFVALIVHPVKAATQSWQCEAVTGAHQRYTPDGALTVLNTPLEREITASLNDGGMKLDFVLNTDTMEGVRSNGIEYFPILHNPRLSVVMLMNTHNEVRRVISLYWKTKAFAYVEMQPTISANVPEMRSAMGDCIVSNE